MPPLRLTNLLQTALPDLSSASRAVLSTLGCLNGDVPSAREMAEWVGLRDRYQLARALRRDGLPPLEQLAGWTRVLYWMVEAESKGASLRQLAQRDGVDPAVAYRLVHRVTGRPWSQAQRAGVSVALLRFREQRGMRLVTRRPHQAELPRAMAQAVGDDVVVRSTPKVPAPRLLPSHPAAVLAERLEVGGSPFDVAIAPTGVVLVTRTHAAAVDVIRLEPLGVARSIRTGPTPSRVIPDLTGTYAYVTNQFAEEVGIIDLVTLRQCGTIPVCGHPLGAVLAPDGHTLLVTTNLDRLCAISIPKGRVVASVPVPMGSPQITLHPSGRRAYVPCYREGVIVEVDAHTLCPRRRFEVGGVPQDVVVTRDGLTLYAANEAGWLDAIHLPTGRVSRLTFGMGALGVALSPDEQILLVSLMFHGRVAVVDPATLTVRDALVTGGKPRLMAFDRGGRWAVVANEAGWVDLIR